MPVEEQNGIPLSSKTSPNRWRRAETLPGGCMGRVDRWFGIHLYSVLINFWIEIFALLVKAG
jgi:hypothetical protein